MADELNKQLISNFFRYLKISSQSDPRANTIPSSSGQWESARCLEAELKAIGLKNIKLSEECILTGYLPGTVQGVDKVGFCAHMDTVDVSLSPHVRPQILTYDGEDLCLNSEQNIWFKAVEHPEAAPYVGQEIIFSDGTSVLGADNKSAIAIIMTLLKELYETGEPHGDIYVAFVPDEEIGLVGSKRMELSDFPVEYAYTIDGGEIGEVVYETFNAASVTVTIEGVTAHPMTAKGVLVNPILVAQDFIAKFDRKQTPEETEGREGFWWFGGVSGNQNSCQLQMNIRDHDLSNFRSRKEFVLAAVEELKAEYPRANITCKLTDVYGNISNSVKPSHRAIAQIYEAMEAVGVAPKTIAMRGGTDGSALAEKGLVVPNYFTGGHNFHSRFEFLPVPAFRAAYNVTRKIVDIVAQRAR
ncbi:peptidase T [Pseudovibrio sp. SPO723]|uniref:peptidase T n=1 Tax=Nesiotobacter zosterae TaxID=392721 RepID=UPI0029C1EC0D|nr:peptidase T [Pseudovibrio sp. SPO723]MDX5594375.1 peptidase T [Pseudovibrio sp. SPO723]